VAAAVIAAVEQSVGIAAVAAAVGQTAEVLA